MNRTVEKTITIFCWASGILLLSSIIYIICFIFIKGAPSITMKLIFGETRPLEALFLKKQVFDGLFPAIIGTFALVFLSVTWALPVGISAGIYMAEYAEEKPKKILSFFFDILAGIPSIVVGLFGFAIAVFLHKYFSSSLYPCLLISSLSLAFLVLPYIIRTTQVSLENLPATVRLTAPALGATSLQNIMYVLIPQSLPGILSGIILAIGRCAEDTAVIMLTGVVATAGIPKSLFGNYEALPFYIFYVSSEYSNQQHLMTAYGASIILLSVCLFLFAVAYIIKKHITYYTLYRI